MDEAPKSTEPVVIKRRGGKRPGAGRPKKGAPPPDKPASCKDEYVPQAYKLALLGATDADLAEFFEVAASTIANWKSKHPEFKEALKQGRLPADSGVADRLFQKALGFEFDKAVPIKLKEVIYENGKRVRETERVEVVMVHEVLPPDTVACIFWLKNRRRDQWRDRTDLVVDDPAQLGDAELNVKAAELRKRVGLKLVA